MRIVPTLLLAVGSAGFGYLARYEIGLASWPWFWVAAGVLILLLIADRARGWTWRGAAFWLGASALAVGFWFTRPEIPAEMPGLWLQPWFLVVGLGLLLSPAVRHVAAQFDWHPIRTWLQQRGKRGGRASRWQISKVASARVLRKKAKIIRPSLGRFSPLRRRFCNPRLFATAVARVRGQRIWSSFEDVTLRIGGPRKGKTGELAGRIFDAPGAVVATSTRVELVGLISSFRAERGPVQIFNPSGLGGLASTATFPVLAGCEVPKTAGQRAEDLLAGVSKPGTGGDMEFWNSQGRRVLASLLHAAALGGLTMFDVLEWVSRPDDRDRNPAGLVQQLLHRSPEPAFELDAMQFFATNSRTQSSICATIMPALSWLTDSTAVAAAEGEPFDVERFLAEHGTVILLGSEDSQTAPLVTALTAHIAREGRRIASDQPKGRLDPPLTMALDEAAVICPVPLDRWTADMGGFGITIHICVQGRSQLRQRWGDQGAATILNNTGTLLIFGGSKDRDDLENFSALTGHRWIEAPSEPGAKPTPHRVPTFEPDEIAGLKDKRVLVIRNGMGTAKGRAPMAWKRLDYRAHKLRQRWHTLKQRKAGKLRTTVTAADLETAADAGQVAEEPPVSPASTPQGAGVSEQPHGVGHYRAGQTGGGAPASVTRIHPEPQPAPVHYQPYDPEGEQES